MVTGVSAGLINLVAKSLNILIRFSIYENSSVSLLKFYEII